MVAEGPKRLFRQFARQVLPETVQRRLRRIDAEAQRLRPPFQFSFPTASQFESASPFEFMSDTKNTLQQLGDKYEPTKRLQNYLTYYWMHFRDIRFQVRSVLEIGVESDRSLRMWEEFFPNAMIHGIDIDARCTQFEGGRRRVFIGDQRDYRFLEHVVRQASNAFDIIVDDGSHKTDDQLKSFDFLFPALSEHGIYAIEDTGLGDGLRTVNSLKAIVDHVMYWPSGYPGRDWPYLRQLPHDAAWVTKHVIGIAFYRWIVFVMHGRNPEDNPHLQQRPLG